MTMDEIRNHVEEMKAHLDPGNVQRRNWIATLDQLLEWAERYEDLCR